MDKFLKTRVSSSLYAALQLRASAEGKRLSTYARGLLEHQAEVVTTTDALNRIEQNLRAFNTQAAISPLNNLYDSQNKQMAELLLIARELALATNAQILTRVATQMKLQRDSSTRERQEI